MRDMAVTGLLLNTVRRYNKDWPECDGWVRSHVHPTMDVLYYTKEDNEMAVFEYVVYQTTTDTDDKDTSVLLTGVTPVIAHDEATVKIMAVRQLVNYTGDGSDLTILVRPFV